MSVPSSEDAARGVVRDLLNKRYHGSGDITEEVVDAEIAGLDTMDDPGPGDSVPDLEDDFAACAPMFACIPPGNLWLAAQDRGEVTYTTYRPAPGCGDEPGVEEITGIWLTLADARAVAGGQPIDLSRNMTGWWLYPEEDFVLPW